MKTLLSKIPTWVKVLVGIYLFAFVIGKFLPHDPTPVTTETVAPVSPPEPKSPWEEATEKYDKHFSPWDGSFRPLEKVIKSGMHNPDSYEHVSTTHFVIDTPDLPHNKGRVIMTFRGTNGFGGIVTQTVWVYTDLDGNIISDVKPYKD